MKNKWLKDGYLVFEDFLSRSEVQKVEASMDRFLSGFIDTTSYRSDLSGNKATLGNENITQIMRPSLIETDVSTLAIYPKTLAIAKNLLGDDVALDFDMIINKSPNTKTPTPWHQDAAYWPQLEDKRACSFWIALDDVDEENGCMQYIAGSHDKPLQAHSFIKNGAALETVINTNEISHTGILNKGGTIVHHGHTLHGAFGNKSTDRQRRAWIINYRPKAMIEAMRKIGFNHLGVRNNKTNQ